MNVRFREIGSGGFMAVVAVVLAIGSLVPVKPQAPSPSRSVRPSMVLIKGGTFEMGQAAEDLPKLQKTFKIKRAEVFAAEAPKHRVKLSSFFLDKFEVTNAEFKKFIDAHPEWQKTRIPAELQNGNYLSDWNGNDFPAGKANYPVAFVSWYAAVAFCQADGSRLPTEAEWEFAANGGKSSRIFPWGDEMPDKTLVNFSQSGIGATVTVGSYRANGFGLFDMAGNVWEFTADEWSTYSNTNTPQIDPVAGGDRFEGSSYLQAKTRRVIRGGSFGASPVNLRVTYRDSHLPANATPYVGFRCAKDAVPKKKS